MFQAFIKDFFMDESDMVDKLNLFGWEHLLLLAITISAALAIYFKRDSLKSWKHKEHFRFIMAGVFFLNMVIFYMVFIVKGIYDWHIHLPLHLCFISGFMFMAVLVTGSKKFFKIVYFFTWVGPLPAMMWPNTPTQFDRYLTYQFFISHHVLLLMGLFCLFVLDYKVEKKDIFKAFVCGNVIFALVFVFNSICGTNYIMTGQLPVHIIDMFPFLANFNYPIIWLELCGIVMMFLAYLPTKLTVNAKCAKSLATEDDLATAKI